MYKKAFEIIRSAKHLSAFTGAGISVESGIPAFNGKNGLWERYDPSFIDISFFIENPVESWQLLQEVLYFYFNEAVPNTAHYVLSEMEVNDCLGSVITQNIDNLHHEAGNKNIYEFHGTSQYLVCLNCSERYLTCEVDLFVLPPYCAECGGILKPDFVFFGENIPEPVNSWSFQEAESSDVFILIGTAGEIKPASNIPYIAKKNGAKIIEVNIERTIFTDSITDVFIKGRATEVMEELAEFLF
ncbi:MAG: RNA polymerase subunit sigma [Desulfobacterales bacterium]|jgi:NAD-dependent deacetylase|nr:RNA polymerase subunit sigma [Desulfobacteraceae bacterium]MBT4364461.1 RNA polymerase subunit sigma [Desulfobacteraceae bacterium]MBT7087287.1 RNA polymerase subunit sigma [Desulfobacterales bacterium]